MKTPTVKFLGEECTIEFGYYSNGRTSIKLICEDGSPMAVATVNLHNEPLDSGMVFVKDYNENKRILKALVSAGIVEDTGKQVSTGFVSVPVAKLLVAPK